MCVYCIRSSKSSVPPFENHVIVFSSCTCTVHVSAATGAGSQVLQNVSMCTPVCVTCHRMTDPDFGAASAEAPVNAIRSQSAYVCSSSE
jgi:hypothetical protein